MYGATRIRQSKPGREAGEKKTRDVGELRFKLRRRLTLVLRHEVLQDRPTHRRGPGVPLVQK